MYVVFKQDVSVISSAKCPFVGIGGKKLGMVGTAPDPRFGYGGGGGGRFCGTLTMNVCEARGGYGIFPRRWSLDTRYEKRVLSVSGPITKGGVGGGGGGGGSCFPYDDTMIYIFVCVRVRDRRGAAALPKPMLDPGLGGEDVWRGSVE